MYKSMTLTPAYGRDYKSRSQLLEHWNMNKDFVVADVADGNAGRYFNRLDLAAMVVKPTHIHFRYKNNTRVHVMEVK